MGSGFVISKSLGNLALPFLHFCKKYDICNLSRGALTGAFGKISKVLKSRIFVRSSQQITTNDGADVTTEYLKNNKDLIFTGRIWSLLI